MSTTSIVLSALLTVTLLIIIAPSILAMNRGRILQNIAIWLAIMLVLALAYQNFGPGKDSPMNFTTGAENPDAAAPPAPNAPPSGDQGYVPPRE